MATHQVKTKNKALKIVQKEVIRTVNAARMENPRGQRVASDQRKYF